MFFPCIRIETINDIFDKEEFDKVVNDNIDKVNKFNLSLLDSVFDDNAKELVTKIQQGIDIAINKANLTLLNLNNFISLINIINQRGYKVYCTVDQSMRTLDNFKAPINYIYNESEAKKLVMMQTILTKTANPDLTINEMNSVLTPFLHHMEGWTIYDVFKANDSIDTVVDYIKSKNFSPFEAMLYIHRYASKFKYNKGKENFDESGRVITSIFKDKEIVCSGYASLVKAIVDKLGNKNLKAHIIGNEFVKGNQRVGHCLNVISIKDSKYDINGIYLEDACSDCKISDNSYSSGYGNCLFPVSDLNHYLGIKTFSKLEKSRLFNLIYSKEDNYQKNDIFDKYKYKGKAIELETYKKALIAIYYAKYENLDKAKQVTSSEIKKSMNRCIRLYDLDSKNTFVRAYIDKNKYKTKKTRYY